MLTRYTIHHTDVLYAWIQPRFAGQDDNKMISISPSGSLLKTEKRAIALDDRLRGEKMAKPVWKTKAGSVSGALWENTISVNGRDVVALKATVQRRYRDKDGTWKSSGSFSRNEIPLAIYCLQKCFEHMIEGQKDDDSVEEEVVM